MDAQNSFLSHDAPVKDKRYLPVQPPGQVIGRNRELAATHTALKAGQSVLLAGPVGIGKTALAAVLATAQIASNPGGVLWLNLVEDDLPMLIARVGRAYGLDSYTPPEQDWADKALELIDVLEKARPTIVIDGVVDLKVVAEFIQQCVSKLPMVVLHEQAASGPWTVINLAPLSDPDAQAVYRYYAGQQAASQPQDIAAVAKLMDGLPMSLELAGRLSNTDKFSAAELIHHLPTDVGRDSHQAIMELSFRRLEPASQGLLLLISALFTGRAGVELISQLGNMPPATAVSHMRRLAGRGMVKESIRYGQIYYTVAESALNFARNWLDSYGRLKGMEDRALNAVVTYIEHHANPQQTSWDRLAAEMDNIVGAAAYATAQGNITVLNQLVDALNQRAGSFINQRLFRPELAQIQKLQNLLANRRSVSTPPAVTAVSMPSLAPTPSVPAPLAPVEVAVESTPLPPPPLVEPTATLSADVAAIEVAPSLEEALHEKPVASTALDEPLGAAIPLPVVEPEPTVFAPPPPVIEVPAEPAVTIEDTNTLIDTEPLELDPPFTVTDQPAAPVAPSSTFKPFSSMSAAATSTPLVPLTSPEIDANTVEEDTESHTPVSMKNIYGLLDEARAKGDRHREALLLQTLGQFELDQGQQTAALAHYKQALTGFEETHDQDGMLATLDVLTMLATHNNDLQNALLYATRGLNQAEQLRDNVRIGKLRTRLGDVRMALGDTPAAVESYTQAVESLRGVEDWTLIGVSTSKLGAAFLAQDRVNEAMQMFETALAMFRRQQRKDHEARVLNRMGNAWIKLRNWRAAEQAFNDALDLVQKEPDLALEAEQYASLAHVRQLQGDLSNTVLNYWRALHVAYQLGDTTLQAGYASTLGEILLEDVRTLNQAIQLLQEANGLYPSNEKQRLLNRAETRVRRSQAAGVAIPLAEFSPRDYAARAYMA